MIPPNTIIPFDGLHASIPDGWVRDTRFDDKFIKGASTGLGETGGSATHSHTGSPHSHTMINHTHAMHLGLYVTTFTVPGGGSDRRDGTDTGHTHWGNDWKYSTALGNGTLSDTIAYPQTSVTPAHYNFIFIKATTYKKIPYKGIVFSQANSRPGLVFHAASANKHIKGSVTNADAGTSGGSDTHTHNVSHTHAAVNHYHTGATLVDTSDARLAGDGIDEGTYSHAHTLVWDNVALAGATATLTTPALSNVPLTKTINTFIAGYDTLLAEGDIVLTTVATPIGWLECDGNNGTPNLSGYYLRTNNVAGAITEMGANTHSHAANNSHAHGSASHTHAGYTDTAYAYGRGEGSGKNITPTHTHNVFDPTSNNASWNAVEVSASSTDSNEPPYIKVKFIQATKQALGGTASIMGSFI